MTAFLTAAAWWLVLWCPVARQPRERQIGALSGRPGTTMRAQGARPLDEIARRASRHGLRRRCGRTQRPSVPGIYGRIMSRIACATDMASEQACRFGAGVKSHRGYRTTQCTPMDRLWTGFE